MLKYEASVHLETTLQILRYTQKDTFFNLPNTYWRQPGNDYISASTPTTYNLNAI